MWQITCAVGGLQGGVNSMKIPSDARDLNQTKPLPFRRHFHSGRVGANRSNGWMEKIASLMILISTVTIIICSCQQPLNWSQSCVIFSCFSSLVVVRFICKASCFSQEASHWELQLPLYSYLNPLLSTLCNSLNLSFSFFFLLSFKPLLLNSAAYIFGLCASHPHFLITPKLMFLIYYSFWNLAQALKTSQIVSMFTFFSSSCGGCLFSFQLLLCKKESLVVKVEKRRGGTKEEEEEWVTPPQ